MPSYDVDLEGSVQESSSLPCRSQAYPGDKVRDGHTYSVAQVGTEGPRLMGDMSPGPVAGEGVGHGGLRAPPGPWQK